jgi:hypothetical protein
MNQDETRRRSPKYTPSGERLYSLTDVAKLVHVHFDTVKEMVSSGALVCVPLGRTGRNRYVLESEIERFLRSRPSGDASCEERESSGRISR